MVANGIKLAIGTYVPRPYAGPTLLLTTDERKSVLLNERSGYPTLVSDLTVAELGGHHGDMFKGGMATVVEAIEDFAARVAA